MRLLGPKRFAALVVGGPLIVLFVLIVIVAPAIRKATTQSRVGDDYVEHVDHDIGVKIWTPTESAADGKTAAEFVRAFPAAIGRELSAMSLRTPGGTLEVFLLRSHDDLNRFGWDDAKADFTNNGGYYDPSKGRIACIGPNWETLAHELTHAMIDATARQDVAIPIWLNEGMAQYCETWSPPDYRFGVIDHVRVRADRLRAEGKLPGLWTVIGAPPDAYFSAENTGYYLVSHLFVAWMLDGDNGAHRDAFQKLFSDALQGKTINDLTLKGYLMLERNEIERRYEAFVTE